MTNNSSQSVANSSKTSNEGLAIRVERLMQLWKLHGTQPFVGWGFLGEVLAALRQPDETSPQAPIARIRVANDRIVDAKILAPGLPTGVHSLYCEPEAVAPYMRAAEKASEGLQVGAPECAIKGCGNPRAAGSIALCADHRALDEAVNGSV